ncbi:MAG: DUF87 domain-containing protein [Acidobacteria bacterium]|nr:MAG: DUF87 domain-containing protein [Acidobacteriota bacterium]REK04481.1 MAG: DUF87 domain-containing protein [Acidobacteriota bacterium]
MSITWRFWLVLIQLTILVVGVWLTTGAYISTAPWYLAGLLAVVINPAMFEPLFPKRGDVLGNSVLAFFLATVSLGGELELGWLYLRIPLVLVGGAAALTIVGEEGSFLSTVSRRITALSSAMVLYSAVFWISIAESFPIESVEFWNLAAIWVTLVFLHAVKWENLFISLRPARKGATPVELVGPSRLRVKGQGLPAVGMHVEVSGAGANCRATVVARIPRSDSILTELFLHKNDVADDLVAARELSVTPVDEPGDIVGHVAAGSSVGELLYSPAEAPEIGAVVFVESSGDKVLYQVIGVRAGVLRADGSETAVPLVQAMQLGLLRTGRRELSRYLSLPALDSEVRSFPAPPENRDEWPALETSPFELGHVRGTTVPVSVDLERLCEGHTAILGMTKMGKSHFARLLVERLAQDGHVLVMDQTGEYRRRMPSAGTYQPGIDWTAPGLSIWEPGPHTFGPPGAALGVLNEIEQQAMAEYRTLDIAGGEKPTTRVILIEEAHQFIPEPAVIGYKGIGHDQSLEIGKKLMQIRKYGVSIIFVSQRTAVVSKTALSQCENLVAFRTVDHTGLDYMAMIAGDGIKSIAPQIPPRQALLIGDAFSCENPIAIDVRGEFTQGTFPTLLGDRPISAATEIDEDDIPF